MTDFFGRLGLPALEVGDDRIRRLLKISGVVVAAAAFVLLATGIVAFDILFAGAEDLSGLQVGDIAPVDIRAPFDWQYESQVLTERARQAAVESTAPVFDPPDPSVARQQVQLARQILDFIDNVRRDPYATTEQRVASLSAITALTLEPEIIDNILTMPDESWRAVDAEIITVLERILRTEIRESNVSLVRSQLPMQVSVRFGNREGSTVVAIVEDLIRPNTFPNPEATEAAQLAAAESVPPEVRAFEQGQIVVREGARVEPVDYEALAQFGLLQTTDQRPLQFARALLMSIIVMILAGLYIARFRADLFNDPRFLTLLAALFLIVLAGARVVNFGDQFYIYPTAALALLFVALAGAEMAVVGVLGLSILIGVMSNQSFELVMLVVVGGLMGTLTLRRSERLNSFFIAGLVVALANVLIVTIFNLEMLNATEGANLGLLILYSVVNGVFAAAVALACMYVVTLLFNLPTSLKLVELNQPSQPLLQRLLREAPGTYQHSLQVANLSEQAANAVGANAELVRVAALYHDIGKMMNPAFFVENQADNVNPHDVLNDPYRSASIIISHVTDGERLARQYRLPARIHDFILEHHGTTLVSYFYRQALEQADDPDAVDVDQFTYPGPRPQSRETAIMMLADSCESTVRARKPSNKQEISDIVQTIIDTRMRDGQLDDSALTSNDIKTIRNIFVEMLQAVFHPRINYPSMPGETPRRTEVAPETSALPLHPEQRTADNAVRMDTATDMDAEIERVTAPVEDEGLTVRTIEDDDDSPLPEVPPLRRTQTQPSQPANGTPERDDTPVEDRVDGD